MYLNFEDRKKIERLYSENTDIKDIAQSIGVCVSTMYREIQRGITEEMDKNGRFIYSAEKAQKRIKHYTTKKIIGGQK